MDSQTNNYAAFYLLLRRAQQLVACNKFFSGKAIKRRFFSIPAAAIKGRLAALPCALGSCARGKGEAGPQGYQLYLK
jgi:hypothetical protein